MNDFIKQTILLMNDSTKQSLINNANKIKGK